MTSEVQGNQDRETRAQRTRGGNVYRPLVDILEQQDEWTLVADMPGVKSESLDVDFEDGVLTIQGKVEPRYPENANFLLREYGIGDFYRTFRVSEQVDPGRIHAEYVDGVLHVTLKKAQEALPKRIPVKAG